jgi:Flp pilus assembly protein CpaB
MTYRVKNIGIAVILAAFAGLLTIFYVANYKRHVQHGEKSVSVLVAARDIPAGTTGSEVVERHYLKTETVPRRTVVPGAISSSDELHNLVATGVTYRGEQVTASRFGTPTELGVRAQLKANERAYQMEGSANELLAGTLQQGDHVDVVANWEAPEGASPPHHTAKVIVRNLLVLVAPEAPNSGGKLGESQSQFSVQLRATDEQVQKIFYARKNGDVSLILRPPADSQNSPRFVDDWRTLVGTR